VADSIFGPGFYGGLLGRWFSKWSADSRDASYLTSLTSSALTKSSLFNVHGGVISCPAENPRGRVDLAPCHALNTALVGKDLEAQSAVVEHATTSPPVPAAAALAINGACCLGRYSSRTCLAHFSWQSVSAYH
jgi:hypothetical protein